MPVVHDLTLREFLTNKCDQAKFFGNKGLYRDFKPPAAVEENKMGEEEIKEETMWSSTSSKFATIQFEVLFLSENLEFQEQDNKINQLANFSYHPRQLAEAASSFK